MKKFIFLFLFCSCFSTTNKAIIKEKIVTFSRNELPYYFCFCFEQKITYTQNEFFSLQEDINDPFLAFIYIKDLVKFEKDNDYKELGCFDYWSSSLETLSSVTGDCEDGAILFAALLADDQKFNVKVIFLKSVGHVVASFEENGKVGIISFNDNSPERSTFFPPIYSTVDEYLMRIYKNDKLVEYSYLDFAEEEMIFGIDKKTGTCGLREKFVGQNLTVRELKF